MTRVSRPSAKRPIKHPKALDMSLVRAQAKENIRELERILEKYGVPASQIKDEPVNATRELLYQLSKAPGGLSQSVALAAIDAAVTAGERDWALNPLGNGNWQLRIGRGA